MGYFAILVEGTMTQSHVDLWEVLLRLETRFLKSPVTRVEQEEIKSLFHDKDEILLQSIFKLLQERNAIIIRKEGQNLRYILRGPNFSTYMETIQIRIEQHNF